MQMNKPKANTITVTAAAAALIFAPKTANDKTPNAMTIINAPQIYVNVPCIGPRNDVQPPQRSVIKLELI